MAGWRGKESHSLEFSNCARTAMAVKAGLCRRLCSCILSVRGTCDQDVQSRTMMPAVVDMLRLLTILMRCLEFRDRGD